ncbi:hypothetical protein RI129_000795 [Pyrocoelia pectoralis]|uniref:PIH1 domain-containing protein 1 n=1 Tax=Pyrocoelia pectoralis TaxID=417401 RepID=A0AAN7VS76_9COLE
MSPQPVFLDVDSSLVENKLRITEDNENDVNKIFGEHPSTPVIPEPGFCVKSKETATNTKIFINICYTNVIPPPTDISEEELILICNSEENSSFKIPMSIGEINSENDKHGNEVKITDVAIHSTFYKKIQERPLFKDFFIAVAFEGIKTKHKISTTEDRIILKNRKCFGQLQVHRIRQSNDYAENKSEAKVKNYLEGLRGTETNNKPKIETISSEYYNESSLKAPKYRLFRKINDPSVLHAEVKLLKIMDSAEVNVDVGEDRIIVESKSDEYYLDVFVPFIINQTCVTATFNKHSKVLKIVMPLCIK